MNQYQSHIKFDLNLNDLNLLHTSKSLSKTHQVKVGTNNKLLECSLNYIKDFKSKINLFFKTVG